MSAWHGRLSHKMSSLSKPCGWIRLVNASTKILGLSQLLVGPSYHLLDDTIDLWQVLIKSSKKRHEYKLWQSALMCKLEKSMYDVQN